MSIVKLIDEAKDEQSVTILSQFYLEDFNKEYIIYHMDEKDERDMIKLYAGTVVANEDKVNLLKIETDAEWMKIKEVMKEMAVKGMSE